MATSIYYTGRGKKNYFAVESKGDYFEIRRVSNGGLYTSVRKDVVGCLELIADFLGVAALRNDYQEIMQVAVSKLRHGGGPDLFSSFR